MFITLRIVSPTASADLVVTSHIMAQLIIAFVQHFTPGSILGGRQAVCWCGLCFCQPRLYEFVITGRTESPCSRFLLKTVGFGSWPLVQNVLIECEVCAMAGVVVAMATLPHLVNLVWEREPGEKR